MITQTSFETLITELCKLFPNQTVEEQCRAQIRTVLTTGLNKLDLVTREEFDAQVKVLHRTREKLESLKTELTALQNNKKD